MVFMVFFLAFKTFFNSEFQLEDNSIKFKSVIQCTYLSANWRREKKKGMKSKLPVFAVVMILLTSMFLVAVQIIPTSATPDDWYVDGTLGTDDETHGTGPGADAFKTIQYAINGQILAE